MNARKIGAGLGLALALAAAAQAQGDGGALLYSDGGKAVRFELATRRESSSPLSSQGTDMLGYGGGVVTELEVLQRSTSAPDRYTLKLLRAAGRFSGASALPPFSISKGHVSGPVQPAPGAALFALHTRESAGLGEPVVDHVYVFDDASRVRMHWAGYRDPVWLGGDALVVVADDGLYRLGVGAAGPAARIGARGLGESGVAPKRPAVSPDGRSIAFVQGEAVWRIGVDGSGLVRLTRPRPGQTWPAWSPDGSRLVVVRRACPPLGGAAPNPELVVIAAGSADQDIERLPLLMREGGVPVRSCGPVYWIR